MSGQTHIVSWSELDTFRQCPFKHQLAYKDRWSKTPAIGSPLSRGTLFHFVMENHYNCLKAVKDKNVDAVALFTANINKALGTEHPTARNEEQVLVAWIYEGYVQAYGKDSEWEVVAVEYANEFWLPTDKKNGGRSHYKLKVKIDLIMRHKVTGELWIWDHKTCKDLPNSDLILELDDQFGLYTWAMRKLGFPVMGSIYNACRTLKYKDPKKPQPLEERFKRIPLYRTDEELDVIAVEAYKTARRAWSQTPYGTAERNPNKDTCNYRCDFTDDCLGSRKGINLRKQLILHGFTQNRERH
jgi:hypothetical protein